MQEAHKFVFAGATVAGRPAHIRAADAQKHAEAKARKANADSTASPKEELKAAPAKNSAATLKAISGPKGTESNAVSAVSIPASIPSVQQPDHKQTTGHVSTHEHASQAAHVAVEDFESVRAEEGGTAALLNVALAAAPDGEDGAVSVKLQLIEPEAVQAVGTNTADTSVDVISNVQEASVVDRKDGADNSSVINKALGDLSLPVSPGAVDTPLSQGGGKSSEMVTACSNALSPFAFDATVGEKDPEGSTNPLFSGGGGADYVQVDLTGAPLVAP